MSRVPLDENIPVALRPLLDGHEVFSVDFLGWKGVSNGRLLDAAEAARFDVLIPADQNLQFQQNLVGRSLAVVVLSTTNWNAIRNATDEILAAIGRATMGSVTGVALD